MSKLIVMINIINLTPKSPQSFFIKFFKMIGQPPGIIFTTQIINCLQIIKNTTTRYLQFIFESNETISGRNKHTGKKTWH